MKVDKSLWQKKTLSDFFELQMGKTPSRKDLSLWEDGDTPWVSISDMKDNRFISDAKEALSKETISQCRIPIIPIGTVIMSFKLTIGKTCIVAKPLVTNEAIMAFFPKEGVEVDSSFLAYALSALKWKGNRAVKGITINKKTISDKVFSLPPLDQQVSIASELDALQEVINGYKAQISDLDALAQSIFLDTFGDPITNTKSWNTKRLSDVCLLTPSSELNESIVWSLSLEQIESQTGIITEYVTINKDDLGTSTFPFDEEMVLYSKLRPYLNKVVLPKYKGYATTELVPLTPDTSCLNRIFLAYLLRSKTVVSTLNCKTGGARMPRTNMNYFRSFPIILPPNELQKQFALQVETIEQQKDLLSQQLADAEMLMAERMQYYFS